MEGVEVFGLAEESVQADFQEVQFVQEGGGVGLVGMALLVGQLAAEMSGVAAEGRRAEVIVGGQGAEGHSEQGG